MNRPKLLPKTSGIAKATKAGKARSTEKPLSKAEADLYANLMQRVKTNDWKDFKMSTFADITMGDSERARMCQSLKKSHKPITTDSKPSTCLEEQEKVNFIHRPKAKTTSVRKLFQSPTVLGENGSNISKVPVDTIDEVATLNISQEFKNLEAICASPKPQLNMIKSNPINQNELLDQVKRVIESQEIETRRKIDDLLTEHSNNILEKINEIFSKSVPHEILDCNQSRKKANKQADLRVNMLQRSLKKAIIPDTPSTRLKMKKAANLYNSTVYDVLDSPRLNRTALSTPTSNKSTKTALSLTIQKQCLDLIE